MKVHCLFEQSGTFKNEFKKLGIEAEDYDILNDFGETDHVMDLFAEIKKGYNEEPSLFDAFKKEDLIMAFFPCVRFENQAVLMFRGQQAQMKKWSDEKKMENCMKMQRELTELYELVNMLFIICIRRGLKLIVENPYSEEHYLRRYWCLPATIIDKDRRVRGDFFRKPTQFWFVNCEPKHNFIFEAQNLNVIQHKGSDSVRWISGGVMEREAGIKCTQRVARSLIHKDYANRFIREFILSEEQLDDIDQGHGDAI